MDPLTPRALERRLKRYVLKETHDFLAVGAPGFEAVLLREVQALPNVMDARIVRGGVEFRGPYATIYHANLQLATAHRVLWRVAEFLAQSYPMLFNKSSHLPWERYVGFQSQLRFSVSSRSSRLHHAPKIAETLHSAVQSTLETLGLRPQLSEDAALEVHVRLFRDRCTLSLNTSGEHLHRRGYRTHVGGAPLRETLAAALLQTALLQPAQSDRAAEPLLSEPTSLKTTLSKTSQPEAFDLIVDPMCGSGTLLLEVDRLLRGVPPGGERNFAFEHFPGFQKTLWERLKRDAKARVQPTTATLRGFDKDARAVQAAEHNAKQAGTSEALSFSVADALTLPYDALRAESKKPLLVCNPPYGRRLDAANARRLYRDFSAALQAAPGWSFAILTPEPSWLELPQSAQLEFRNGGLKVYLVSGVT